MNDEATLEQQVRTALGDRTDGNVTLTREQAYEVLAALLWLERSPEYARRCRACDGRGRCCGRLWTNADGQRAPECTECKGTGQAAQ